MMKYLIVALFFGLTLNAQNKKPAAKKPAGATAADSLAAVAVKEDTTDYKAKELAEKRQFGVYTRKPRKSDKRTKLCMNLVAPEAQLNLCINDSICKSPEVFKVLFTQREADSNFVLVYVDAITKADDKPACDAGHETKLFFIRWDLKTNKCTWKQRTVNSCMKAVTNMTKEPIPNWDGNSVLVLNYHRGSTSFVEVKFDPKNYKLGFQSAADQ